MKYCFVVNRLVFLSFQAEIESCLEEERLKSKEALDKVVEVQCRVFLNRGGGGGGVLDLCLGVGVPLGVSNPDLG